MGVNGYCFAPLRCDGPVWRASSSPYELHETFSARNANCDTDRSVSGFESLPRICTSSLLWTTPTEHSGYLVKSMLSHTLFSCNAHIALLLSLSFSSLLKASCDTLITPLFIPLGSYRRFRTFVAPEFPSSSSVANIVGLKCASKS